MSKELVKWKPSNNVVRIDRALTVVKRGREVRAADVKTVVIPQKLIEPVVLPATIVQPTCAVAAPVPQVLNLPRSCADKGQLYFARYLKSWYRWELTQMIRPEAGAEIVVTRGFKIDAASIGNERCPWCWAEGRGAIRCGRCNADVCYGKTSKPSFWHPHGYFRCHCGGEGSIREVNESYEGVTWTVL